MHAHGAIDTAIWSSYIVARVLKLTSKLILWLITRCGHALRDIYSSPALQQFLKGMPSRVIHQDKRLYKHGTLRKVRNMAYRLRVN